MKIFKLFFVLLYFLLFSEVSFTKNFIPVEVFSTLPQFRDIEISPDGKKLALFVLTNIFFAKKHLVY